MEPKLTSYEIIRASHRVGEIMDITAHFETRSEEIEQLDKEALALLEALGAEAPGPRAARDGTNFGSPCQSCQKKS